MVRFWHQWDWAAGEREFQRAIELNPNYATAHHWYALSLPLTGNPAKALSEIEKAEALDPLSLGIGSTAAFILYINRRYDQAIDQCRKTLDLDSDFALTHYFLGLACIQKAQYPEAIDALERAVFLSNRMVVPLSGLAHAYAVAGRIADAVRILEELKDASKSRYVSFYDLCCVYAGMGRMDEAFECIEKAFGELGWLSYLNLEPMLDRLKADTSL
jgi:tetratricopeptide (TPR) repeat protein